MSEPRSHEGHEGHEEKGYRMLKITVDFNNLTPDGERVVVARDRDREVIIQLQPGMLLLLHEPGDFEVEAIVEPEEVFGKVWWYGTPDWSTRTDIYTGEQTIHSHQLGRLDDHGQ